jgi:hypothetical protein
MLLQALRPWYNADHEGSVEPGQRFEAGDYRAHELIRAGLAMAVLDETEKVQVRADPPADPPAETEPEPALHERQPHHHQRRK